MTIIKYPNKILRKRSQKVANILNPEIQNFIEELSIIMKENDGIGLSANQVNKDLRIIAVNAKDGPQILINPFFYWKSFKKNIAEEGCLSFPGIFGLVKRPENIRLFYKDKNGQFRHLKADGMLARVIQHESDHLKGVLFIDKVFKYTNGEEKVKDLMNSNSL